MANSGAKHLRLGLAPADLEKNAEQQAYIEKDLLKAQPHFGFCDTLQSHKLNTIRNDWKEPSQLHFIAIFEMVGLGMLGSSGLTECSKLVSPLTS